MPAELIEQLEEMTQRENRSVESLSAALLKEHTMTLSDQTTTDDVAEREEGLQEAQIRLYDIARRFWRDTGNPLQGILDSVSLNPSLWSFGKSARNMAERSREILNNEYADYLLARMKRPPVPRDE